MDGDWIQTDWRPEHVHEFKNTYRDDDRGEHWLIMRPLGPKCGAIHGKVC